MALGERAASIRFDVFVTEQKVPVELELDELDATALHALALVGDVAVGTARLLDGGRIGRMAVLPRARALGVGSALMQALIEAARVRGERELSLHAQTHARDFYLRFGFVEEGGEFDDAGIPHVAMHRSLWLPPAST